MKVWLQKEEGEGRKKADETRREIWKGTSFYQQ